MTTASTGSHRDPTPGPAASGRVPRLDLGDLDPRLRVELEPRVARLGYLGELFAVAAHQPDTLLALMELATAVRSPFPPTTVELVLLTVSEATTNHYERNQHEQLVTRLGFSPVWLREVLACRPAEAQSLSAEERAVQRLVLAVLRDHGHGAGDELTAVTALLGAEAAVGLLLLIGYAELGSMLANTFDLTAPVPPVVSGPDPQ